MKSYTVRVFIFVYIGLLLTGCWSRRELNEMAIAVAMGIDKVGQQYQVTVQVVEPTQAAANQGGGNGVPVTIYKATGSTEIEALRKMTTVSPRRIYSSHLRMFIISEEVAKEGIKNTLDFLSRGQEFRTDFYIVVAKGTKAEQILQVLTPIEQIPANHMFSSLLMSEKIWAPTTGVTLVELLTDILRQGKEPVLTGIQFTGNPDQGVKQDNLTTVSPQALLGYKNLAVFKDDKLVGWLNETESIGYNFIIDNIKSSIVNIPCPQGGHLGFEIFQSSTDLKGFLKDGKPIIIIEIRTEGNISEANCSSLDLTSTKVIQDLESTLEQKIKKDIEKVLKISQTTLKADIFGFGEVIHRSNLTYWDQAKDDWDEIFMDVPVDIKIDLKIRRIGSINNPL